MADIESLLAAHDQAGDFLEPLDLELDRRLSDSSFNSQMSAYADYSPTHAHAGHDAPGGRIGPYKLLQLLQ